MQLLASSLSWLWLAVQQPPRAGPEPVAPAQAGSVGGVPSEAVPKPGVIEMSPEWLPPSAATRPKPVIGRARIDRLHLESRRIDEAIRYLLSHPPELDGLIRHTGLTRRLAERV